VPPVAAEARGGEGIRDGRMAVPDQQGGLEGDGHGFGEAAGACLGRVGRLLAQPGDRLVQAVVGARGQVQLGEEGLGGLGLAGQRAQPVQRGDVARALPDGSERRLTVQPGHP